MSIGSFFKSVENEAVKFEHVAIKAEQVCVNWLETTFGKQSVDTALQNLDSALQTDLGKLVAQTVMRAENDFGKLASGTTKASAVLSWVSAAAQALGIPAPVSAINVLLNMFAPFVENKLGEEIHKVLAPSNPPAAPPAN